MPKKTIIQYFEWYLPADSKHWLRAAEDAAHLADLGITDVWLPPAYKGHSGVNDVGYGVYDLYDLGEFDQKGTVPTKYGTKDEYLAAIEALHGQGLAVMSDMVLNHRMGADFLQETTGHKMDSSNRLKPLAENKNLGVWTGFDFPGRNGKYSDFVWTKAHFSSVDWNQLTETSKIFKLSGHLFSKKVSQENGNYDYLMGADVDYSIPAVVEEIRSKLAPASRVIVVEEVCTGSGVGDALARNLPDHHVSVLDLGDKFATHGAMNTLYKHYGLDAQSIADYTWEAIRG